MQTFYPVSCVALQAARCEEMMLFRLLLIVGLTLLYDRLRYVVYWMEPGKSFTSCAAVCRTSSLWTSTGRYGVSLQRWQALPTTARPPTIGTKVLAC